MADPDHELSVWRTPGSVQRTSGRTKDPKRRGFGSILASSGQYKTLPAILGIITCKSVTFKRACGPAVPVAWLQQRIFHFFHVVGKVATTFTFCWRLRQTRRRFICVRPTPAASSRQISGRRYALQFLRCFSMPAAGLRFLEAFSSATKSSCRWCTTSSLARWRPAGDRAICLASTSIHFASLKRSQARPLSGRAKKVTKRRRGHSMLRSNVRLHCDWCGGEHRSGRKCR